MLLKWDGRDEVPGSAGEAGPKWTSDEPGRRLSAGSMKTLHLKNGSGLSQRGWFGWCLCVVSALTAFSAVAQTPATQHLHLLTADLVLWEVPDVLVGTRTNPVPAWVSGDGTTLQLPAASTFDLRLNGAPVPVSAVTLTRQARHAEVAEYKVDVVTRVFLRLQAPIAEAGTLSATHAAIGNVQRTLSTNRESPAILVNRVGYVPNGPKRAFVYLALGDWNELTLVDGTPFAVIDSGSGASVFTGTLRRRADVGFNTTPLPYQGVSEAEFTAMTTPGDYRIAIPGLGVSPVFHVSENTAGQGARSAALGLYHQRSGVALTQPYTRFTRGAGHLAPAEVPDGAHPTNPLLAQSSSDYSSMPRHTAPQLANVTNSLYPFVRLGTVDVSGGHHDAGDYSKYTINSAQLIHEVAFAAENFPGAGALDNLGLPESGDGVGDLWQIAKREADFLAKLQDLDGGFYFLVYPRARRYENNVMPAQGDPQVVWPKNTAATAAAAAALAQLGGAPEFRLRYPADADRFIAAATNAWNFLQAAFTQFGRDGAYQKLTHYGNDYLHDDEVAWAAAALYAATGDTRYETALMSWMPDPTSRNIRRWTWWRLFGSWGNAIRAYVFADGRPGAASRNAAYLATCRNELIAGGTDQALRAEQSALGISFPSESKRIYSAGWYFPQAAAFDLAVAMQATPDPTQRQRFESALWSNLGFAWGANPGGITFVTGTGDESPIEPVSQVARNDREKLPPSGTPVGNPTSGFSWLDRYQRTFSSLMYPPPSRDAGRFPLYDRFTDVFNTSTEATIVEMGQALAVGAAVFGASPLATAGTNLPPALTIAGLPDPLPLGGTATLTVSAPGENLAQARITWETPQGYWTGGTSYVFTRTNAKALWLEVEAVMPDGRRLYGSRDIATVNRAPTVRPKTASVTLPSPVTSVYLEGIAEDDGLPGPLAYQWTQTSGPAAADLTNPNSVATHAAFPAVGTYTFDLTLDDSEFTAVTNFTVSVTGKPASNLEGVADASTAFFEPFAPGSVVTGTFTGGAQLAFGAQFWSRPPEGVVLRTRTVGDQLSYLVQDFLSAADSRPVTLEAYTLIRGTKGWGVSTVPILSLNQAWDARLEIYEDKWSTGRRPSIRIGQTTLVTSSQWDGFFPTNRWIRIALGFNPANGAAAVWVDGQLVAQGTASLNSGRTTPWTLLAGNLDADVDEIRVHRGFGPWVQPELATPDAFTIALHNFDYSLSPATVSPELTAYGDVAYEPQPGWMHWPVGSAISLGGYGSRLTAAFSDGTLQPDAGQPLALEVRFKIDKYDAYGKSTVPLISLQQGYDAQLHIEQAKWTATPSVRLGNNVTLSSSAWASLVSTGVWHHLAMQWNGLDRSDIWIDGIRRAETTLPQNSRRTGDWTLTLGNFQGEVDELRISRTLRWQDNPEANTLISPPAAAWTAPTGAPVAWVPLDGTFANLSNPGQSMTSAGTMSFVNVTGSTRKVLATPWYGSHAWLDIPDASMGTVPIRLSAWILPETWAAYSVATAPIISLNQAWDARLELTQDKWATTPDIIVGANVVVPREVLAAALTPNAWHRIEVVAEPQSDLLHAIATVTVDGVVLGTDEVSFNWLRTTDWQLEVGNFRGATAGVGVTLGPTF